MLDSVRTRRVPNRLSLFHSRVKRSFWRPGASRSSGTEHKKPERALLNHPNLFTVAFFSPCDNPRAWVAELVDARDLKSLGPCVRAGSTPALGTNHFKQLKILFAHDGVLSTMHPHSQRRCGHAQKV